MRKQFTSRRAETNEVKKALAAADINAVVSQGKGTAYSWINVNIGSGSQWANTSATLIDRFAQAIACAASTNTR